MKINGTIINPNLIMWVTHIKKVHNEDKWVFTIHFTNGRLDFDFDTFNLAEIECDNIVKFLKH
jgi:hypothetical protein